MFPKDKLSIEMIVDEASHEMYLEVKLVNEELIEK